LRELGAMASSEVQRTLVKSPPELWAELGDPASLARHLGEFGEIRTIRIEPETTVEWEADAARGTVQLKPSGWGTKVTLTVVRETPEAEEPAEPELEPEPVAVAEQPEPAATVEALPESAATIDEQLEPESTRRGPGFLARFFRRRRKARAVEPEQPESDAPDAPAPAEQERELATADIAAEDPPDIAAEDPPDFTVDERPDLATELAQVEQAMAEQDAALLAAVLDRLGAAHHRPFSRG
jgi:hypothetical protein